MERAHLGAKNLTDSASDVINWPDGAAGLGPARFA